MKLLLFSWDQKLKNHRIAIRQAYKKIIDCLPTTNLQLTLKSNTMKNSLQNYKIFFKTMLYNIKIF